MPHGVCSTIGHNYMPLLVLTVNIHPMVDMQRSSSHLNQQLAKFWRGWSSSSVCIWLAELGGDFLVTNFHLICQLLQSRSMAGADSGAYNANPENWTDYCVKNHKIVSKPFSITCVTEHPYKFNYSIREPGGQSPSWLFGQISMRYFNICSCWTIDGSDSKSR